MTDNSPQRYHTQQRMSRIVVHQGTVYLCGQVCTDTGADIKAQTQQTLEKVDALLAEAGSSKERILSALIHIKTMDDFQGMNEVWDAWVPDGHAPARTCVQSEMANPEYRVEITITAAK
ncbi:MAG: RidA family protein [Gammaproteobacteria bacterium]|nr:RidA family protein [Gammaproteobacteria bacterium]